MKESKRHLPSAIALKSRGVSSAARTGVTKSDEACIERLSAEITKLHQLQGPWEKAKSQRYCIDLISSLSFQRQCSNVRQV